MKGNGRETNNIETKAACNAEQALPPASSQLNTKKLLKTDKDHLDQLFYTNSENSNNSGGVSLASIKSDGPPRDKNNCEKLRSNLSFDQSKDGLVPPDIDPAVFRELPQEIKSELLRNWKSKQEFSFSPANRAKSAQPKKQTLLKYFKKK